MQRSTARKPQGDIQLGAVMKPSTQSRTSSVSLCSDLNASDSFRRVLVASSYFVCLSRSCVMNQCHGKVGTQPGTLLPGCGSQGASRGMRRHVARVGTIGAHSRPVRAPN
jgi:hypothetical protein